MATKRLFQKFIIFLEQLTPLVISALCLVIVLPFYIYRWLIASYVATYLKQNIGQLLCPEAHAMSTDLLLSTAEHAPRCSIVSSLTFEGHITLPEFQMTFQKNCLNAQNPSGNLKYPELKQYPENILGYMFWKQDEHFDLNNHLKLHVLDRTHKDTTTYDTHITEICEKLLNAPYPAKRSPWEIHIMQTYMDKDLERKCEKSDKENTEVTLLIIRLHHLMGDGFGFLNLIKNLFEVPDENIVSSSAINAPNNSENILSKINKLVRFSANGVYEVIRIISFHLKRKSIYCSWDSRKKWHQNYERSAPIPITKVKFIKNIFKVRFTTVLNCAFAGALAKMSKRKLGKVNDLLINREYVTILNVIPKPDHPGSLTMHAYLNAFEVPTMSGLPARERLLKCEQNGEERRNSSQAFLIDFFVKALSVHIAPVADFLCKNRFMEVAITNFQGPEVELKWNGKKCIAYDFAVGAPCGVCGVALSVFSYAGFVRICGTAEEGVLSKMELKELLVTVEEEIELLYNLAINIDRAKFKSLLKTD